jgi:hypothetical protein
VPLGVFIIPQSGQNGGYRHQEYSKKGQIPGVPATAAPTLPTGAICRGQTENSGFKAHARSIAATFLGISWFESARHFFPNDGERPSGKTEA